MSGQLRLPGHRVVMAIAELPPEADEQKEEGLRRAMRLELVTRMLATVTPGRWSAYYLEERQPEQLPGGGTRWVAYLHTVEGTHAIWRNE